MGYPVAVPVLTDKQIFRLTRDLIDISSISGHEADCGKFLLRTLKELGFRAEKMPVEGGRFNVYAHIGHPKIVFSTHFDTVPPFIPSSEDTRKIYGRGSCDAKGIIAAMVAAAVRMMNEGTDVGLLFLVGEERDSHGAKVADRNPPTPPPRFLINGEPTENQVAIASKGALRVEVTAHGRMAHSAYPYLGDSAIDKLLHALHRIRRIKLSTHREFGPTTMNIGVIEGGRAPNVIPDFAKAQLLYRLIGPPDKLIAEIKSVAGDLVDVEIVLHIPFVKLRSFAGLPEVVAAFTTDIPALSHWGEPILFGPGSIHVAHTAGEYIEKKQLLAAVDVYCSMAKQLLAG
ncbi:MAG: M20/M25/M40 family metallo-hydrolase [Acidobacteriales bacterium]|nr:M20/M25/M40 family metallo-hydrolase [Terriglobales bacterium]